MAFIPRIKFGNQGFEVSKLGLGCMGLSAFYGAPVAEEDGISLIHYAFNRGITFFDTADVYGPFTNEVLVGKVRQPRFQGENLKKNMVLYERVSALAKKHGCTPAQLALAWVLHQGNDVAPIPGTTKVKNFDENIASLEISLSQGELSEIAAAVPENEVAGMRAADPNYQRTWKFANTPQPKQT